VEQFATSTTVSTRAPIEGDEVVPLSRVRRLIAENMSRSKATIPHAWQTQEVDMSGVAANRAANKAAFQAQEVGGVVPATLQAGLVLSSESRQNASPGPGSRGTDPPKTTGDR
jgi:pyruvate/2-oxoglutarate dehydrogenase complex dihydrolipoamide acyltransferase (E2) component